MTIGKYGYNPEDGPNPDFVRLKQCRDDICQNLGLDWKKVHLSMGMSSDYEQAVGFLLVLWFLGAIDCLFFAD